VAHDASQSAEENGGYARHDACLRFVRFEGRGGGANSFESDRGGAQGDEQGTKKTGKIWIRIFPDMPFTAKPAEVGMGKGKGDPQGYQFIAKAGRVLFEIDGVDEALAKKTLGRAADKMPLRTKFVSRQK
jgi:hypothetical protein